MSPIRSCASSIHHRHDPGRVGQIRDIKPYLEQIALDKLQPEELERWLRELDRRGVGVRTRQCLSRLRTALTLAMRRGYVVRNVAELVTHQQAFARSTRRRGWTI